MSFLAELFIDGTERQILDANILVGQLTDWLGRPATEPQGGLIDIKIKSTREDLFMEWMVSPTMMKNGYIRFYNRDGMSRMADLEFWDCYCVEYYEQFNALYNEAPTIYLKLSPGILRFRHIVFEKHWKETDLAQVDKIIPYTPQQEQDEGKEPKLIDSYYTDMDGRKIIDLPIGSVYFVLKSKNAIGETINIDLSDDELDFKYNGTLLSNDILSNFTIKLNTEQIELEVIAQKL